jgi:hypothetical protein
VGIQPRADPAVGVPRAAGGRWVTPRQVRRARDRPGEAGLRGRGWRPRSTRSPARSRG